MNRLILVVLLSFCALLAYSQEKFLVIGHGGGFTGSVDTYKITPNGEVWKGKGIGEIKYTECARIKKKKAVAYIAKAETEISAANGFNYPSNMYSFLAVTDSGKENKITWGDAQHALPESTRKLYDELQSLVATLKFKTVKK